MSGGSYNYIYSKLSMECEGEMHDEEMNVMIKDLCEVLHDLEWWQSGDYSEDQYRKTVSEFKKKWFNGEQKMKDNETLVELSEDEDEWYQKWYACLGCGCTFMVDNPKYCPGCGKTIVGCKEGDEDER